MAEADSIIAKNPHFDHIDRAPYELSYLLKKMPEHFSAFRKEPDEVCLMAAAAARHADNALTTVLDGIEAMGEILFVAGNNDQNEVSQSSLRNIGCLIRHLSVEAQFYSEASHDFRSALCEQDNMSAKSK